MYKEKCIKLIPEIYLHQQDCATYLADEYSRNECEGCFHVFKINDKVVFPHHVEGKEPYLHVDDCMAGWLSPQKAWKDLFDYISMTAPVCSWNDTPIEPARQIKRIYLEADIKKTLVKLRPHVDGILHA